jgi:hypothetical protein
VVALNLHVCLGVGPGHRLLLGAITPMWSYSVPIVDMTRQSLPPPAPKYTKRAPVQRRAPVPPLPSAAAAKRRERILELLAMKVKHDDIALKVGVCREHVGRIACEAGVARPNRSHDQVRALTARGRALIEQNGWTQARAAAEMGISASYLNQLLVRAGR